MPKNWPGRALKKTIGYHIRKKPCKTEKKSPDEKKLKIDPLQKKEKKKEPVVAKKEKEKKKLHKEENGKKVNSYC